MKSGEEHSTQDTVSRRDGTAVGEGRILFLGAHCDDIEIGCGGTASKLAPSRAIAFAIAADCGENRKAEARTAAARLGLGESKGNLFFGFIPDGRLEERKDVLQSWLKDLVARFQPDAVFVHHGADTHPDHETLYKVVLRVFVHQAIYLYPIPKLAAQAVAFQMNCYEDVSDFIRAKLELCACHVSQAGKGIYLDPEQIEATARVAYVTGFGRTGGYAEAFRIHVTRSSGGSRAVPDASSHTARTPEPAARPAPSAGSAATPPVPASVGQRGWPLSDPAAVRRAAAFAEGYALVIGIANYPSMRPLPNGMLTDTDAIANRLRDPTRCGYLWDHVRVRKEGEARKADIREGCAWLAAHTTERDTAIIYFAGHGFHEEEGTGENFLCPYETQFVTPDGPLLLRRETAITDTEFTGWLRAINAGRLVVILDACHSGGTAQPADPSTTAGQRMGLDERFYERLAQGAGRVILASCRPEEKSWISGVPPHRFFFSQAFLEALDGQAHVRGDGLIRILDVFHYLAEVVPERAAKESVQQHPLLKAQQENNFPIALYSADSRASASEAKPEAGQGIGPDKATLRKALNDCSHGDILLIGAVLEAGLAPSMAKPAAIAHLLDWATTPARRQALHDAIRGSA